MSGLFASGINASDVNGHTTIRVEDAQRLLPYPIIFLYRYSDPRRESILNAFADERTPAQPFGSHIASNASNQLFEGDMALFGIFSDLFMDTGADVCASTPTASGRSQPIAILQSRVDELCSQLFSFSKTRRTADLDCGDIFPVNAAKAVFTAENFEECVWAYFTVFHPQQPLLHWPTFDMHSVSLPLLLAVVFGGSVHCSPTDGALSCRAFFDFGEEFIFEQLRHIVAAKPDLHSDPRAMESVQAGLLIVALQSSFNSEAVRRRVRVSRHPELTVAIRSLRLLDPMIHSSHQNKVPDWDAFIAEESRVR
ncbi:hypothetical protein IG631_09461 [Alternaria alternata]|nr:hypothetical protein IG631_09461 [Alternaria alternata]